MFLRIVRYLVQHSSVCEYCMISYLIIVLSVRTGCILNQFVVWCYPYVLFSLGSVISCTVLFKNVRFLFADNIHVATSASGQRLGCYKIGIHLETFGVWYLVPVWCGTHPSLHLEYGKLRTDRLGVLGVRERIILR